MSVRRNQIRRWLLSKHSTTWGHRWSLDDPDQLEQAAEWFENEIAQFALFTAKAEGRPITPAVREVLMPPPIPLTPAVLPPPDRRSRVETPWFLLPWAEVRP
jgi:hypothetical protein